MARAVDIIDQLPVIKEGLVVVCFTKRTFQQQINSKPSRTPPGNLFRPNCFLPWYKSKF